MPKIQIKKKDKAANKLSVAYFVGKVISRVNAKVGAKVACRLSEETTISQVRTWIPTGIRWLDSVTGGGVPAGRLTEVFGWEGVGKTALCERVVKHCQDMGGIVNIIEPESSLERKRMLKDNVNLEEVIYSAPNAVEEIFQEIDETIAAITEEAPEQLILIVWDSVAGTSSIQELEAEYGEKQYAPAAFVISQAMRKIAGQIAKTNVALLFINQLRENVGASKFEDPYRTYGGHAIGFKAALRINLQRHGIVRLSSTDKKIDGISVKADIIKNKTFGNAPLQFAKFPIMFYEGGISDIRSLFDWWETLGYVTPIGSMYKAEGVDTRFYRKNWPEFYQENKEAIEVAVAAKVAEQKPQTLLEEKPTAPETTEENDA